MEKPARPWLSLVVLCLGTFAVLLDATIVNVALPSIITDLHASLDQALWVINAYLLVFAGLLIVAGRLGDMFGPRRLFVTGLPVRRGLGALRGRAVAGPADRRPGPAGRGRGRADPAGHGHHPGGLPA